MITKNDAIGTTGGQTDESITAIDKAVQAQQARKAGKAGGTAAEGAASATEADKKKRTVLTPQERLDRAAQLEKDRADRAQKRRDDSQTKKDAAQATRGTPHMSKVEKAGKGLAPMDGDTQALFDEIKGGLGGAQIDVLIAHLAFHSRSEATKGSLTVKLEEGMNVRITSGPAKLIGKEGTVTKAQRIHCFVDFGGTKPAYLFNYNVEVIPAPAASEPEAPASGEPAADEAAAA